MRKATKYSILNVRGESLKDSAMADKIIALDRRNMEATLRAVGLEFPEQRRRTTLFHPSNQMVIVTVEQEVVGYVDYCDDLTDPKDVYVSSIQIETDNRGGMLFKLLLSHLLASLRARSFRRIKTNIQKSNVRMMAIAKKAGFTLQENPKNPTTLDVFAERQLLDSPKLEHLFGLKRSNSYDDGSAE
jgi:L-amino acid N-acyltransferase YncA